MLTRLRAWAQELKAQLLTLWFARSHPDTPWYAKALAVLVAAYAFSPIDLIPDFIPVLGYLDDVIIVPLGVWLALRMIPQHVLTESRRKADEWIAARQARPKSYVAATVFVLIWLAAAYGLWTMWRSSID
ncbi:MAG: DUF1232 domain-containing protein [Betaproteobacteria bacterium]|nr:DUF1232 domain-containing protein [Betaproteobacteria bacterium]MBV9362193.1 DUF1232 domain-containing protein [Betaproteobacteria bacterium]